MTYFFILVALSSDPQNISASLPNILFYSYHFKIIALKTSKNYSNQWCSL